MTSAPYAFVRNAKQKPLRVLIVDDEPDFLQLIAFSLEEQGYRVLTASNGLEAVLKARRVQPDAVVLDLMMPGLDGYSACEILRRQLSTRTLPIIVVTAATSEFSRLNALAAGANDFLTKPFSPQELVKRVGRLVEQSITLQQAEEARARSDSDSFPS